MKKLLISFLSSLSFLLFFAFPAFAAFSTSYTPQDTLVWNSTTDFCSSLNYQLNITDSNNTQLYTQVVTYTQFPYTTDLSSLNLTLGTTYNVYFTCYGNSYKVGENTFTYSAGPTPTPTDTPTPTAAPSVQIVSNPATATMSVGTPFNVDVKVTDNMQAFNAAQATVSVSSNLSVTGIHTPSSNACDFQYTKSPTTSDTSFAGAIFGGSSTGCTVYTMTLTPNATGTGTVTFTNSSIKAYADNSEISTGVQDGSFTIGAGAATPTPTTPLLEFNVTSPLQTYLENYTLAGGRQSQITHMYVNGNSITLHGGTQSGAWLTDQTLVLGDNAFAIYGTDDSGNQTATQTVTVNRHTIGDINGDGVVDLIDASLFAVDYGKTSGLTYILSDMNNDNAADLTDLSILAKFE